MRIVLIQIFLSGLAFYTKAERYIQDVTLKMPDGNVLTAVVFADGTYPAINVYSSNKGHDPELVCFAEFNPEHTAGQQLHIGVYQNDEEDTKYYAPYRKEES